MAQWCLWKYVNSKSYSMVMSGLCPSIPFLFVGIISENLSYVLRYTSVATVMLHQKQMKRWLYGTLSCLLKTKFTPAYCIEVDDFIEI
ncbi:Uncharacterized protein TCM_025386 [Theobroma cacao]|uniref:Uncharacterized protein n=1 Tax=Theobroma cacao TaxID=3641 RepID=A0A061EZC3_THECC|nr:Uncharacterized protein TCM_025386 [Theobroma cacao]